MKSILVADGRKYLSAVNLIKGREIRMKRALELLKPIGKAEIPPLAGNIIEQMKEISSLRETCIEPYIN